MTILPSFSLCQLWISFLRLFFFSLCSVFILPECVSFERRPHSLHIVYGICHIGLFLSSFFFPPHWCWEWNPGPKASMLTLIYNLTFIFFMYIYCYFFFTLPLFLLISLLLKNTDILLSAPCYAPCLSVTKQRECYPPWREAMHLAQGLAHNKCSI